MKTIRESAGFVLAAMSIVGLLGVAGWSVYAGRKAVEELTVRQDPIAAEEREGKPAAPDASAEVLHELQQRVQKLEQVQKMPEKIAREAASSVALIIGEYIWTDRTGRRPLRYQDDNDQEHVAFDGRGPIVVRDFTGTGFLLSSGRVLTSGFVLSPWYDDPLLDESEEPERLPSIRMLHAYFPGRSSAVDLKIGRADETASVVICSIEGGSVSAPGLQLSKTLLETGGTLFSIAYPGGVPFLASRLSDDLKRELFKFGTNNTDEVAEWLAARGRIQPVVMQALVSTRTGGKVFYDMLNNLGSTGGPLLNAEGKVAAISQSINSDFPSVNLAVPVNTFKSWIDRN